jgi:hypothetical protein
MMDDIKSNIKVWLDDCLLHTKTEDDLCSAARTNVVLQIVMSTITVVWLVSSLPLLFLHDVFASRHLHIHLLRNDYTVPTRCRHCGGIVDPPRLQGLSGHPPADQPIHSGTGSLNPKYSKSSQFSVIRRFLGIGSHASESYYLSYIVATPGVHRLASQICHNQLFSKNLPQNIQPMNSTEVSSLAAHNSSCHLFI